MPRVKAQKDDAYEEDYVPTAPRRRNVRSQAPKYEEESHDSEDYREVNGKDPIENDEDDVDDENEGDEQTLDEDEEVGDDDEELDEEDEEDEVPSISDEEDNYKLEDPDEIDEDLELRDDEEDEPSVKPVASKSQKIKVSFNKKQDITAAQLTREPRKRQLALYDDNDLDDDESASQSTGRVLTTRRGRRLPVPEKQPQDLDEELLLTDEEAEYNPRANPDLSKMTERQRARYLEEANGKEFLELGNEIGVKKARPRKYQSEQQIALRKAESAKRRHVHKLQQLEEEQQDTVNKLLKRKASKDSSREGSVEALKLVLKPRRPTLQHPVLYKWVSSTSSLNGNSLLTFPAPQT